MPIFLWQNIIFEVQMSFVASGAYFAATKLGVGGFAYSSYRTAAQT